MNARSERHAEARATIGALNQRALIIEEPRCRCCLAASLLHSLVRLTGIPVSVLSSDAGGSYLGGKACWLAYGFHGEPVGQSDCVKQMSGKSGRKNEFLRQQGLVRENCSALQTSLPTPMDKDNLKFKQSFAEGCITSYAALNIQSFH
ncbi:hypothetical protein Baya_6036 [Bagarius yarrelli]|uniref:Uncharacterized protein n=1 Tax=Bagarius yarrelli TaxID=175774 RepID=A0A556U0X6_BAGYA|nr:hypothetical protein Baya_6036 [Bagarius yarrelli]